MATDALYGDDGEMQCSLCMRAGHPWDYRLAPLSDVVAGALASAAADRAELEALRPRRKLFSEREPGLLDLLRKLASGEGGTRAGELKRRGWLSWTVSDAGLAALDKLKETP
jgi:hypothetical protein